MEEEHSDKNTGIDWGSTYDEQVKDTGQIRNNNVLNHERNENMSSIQEKQKKIGPTPKKPSKKKK